MSIQDAIVGFSQREPRLSLATFHPSVPTTVAILFGCSVRLHPGIPQGWDWQTAMVQSLHATLANPNHPKGELLWTLEHQIEPHPDGERHQWNLTFGIRPVGGV